MITTSIWAHVRKSIAALSVVALGAGIFGNAAQAIADRLDRERQFEIPAQPLATALVQFSKQAEMQLVTSSTELGSRETRGISGQVSIRHALESLLDRTGLTYSLVGENTVAIVSPTDARLSTTSNTADVGPGNLQLVQNENQSAQQTDSTSGQSPEEKKDPESPQKDSEESLSEVVVTGTHIRGVGNNTAPGFTIERDAIERSGYSTVQQLIESLPQNFRGGASNVSEDGLIGASVTSAFNLERASSVNLRGLGTVATLVLINGRRVAPSANGAAVDVSLIPMKAIERVEVLTDGSSAIYGSEAVAGVVNFILRDDYEGAETQLRFSTVTEGSQEETRIGQMLGTNWTAGNALLGVQYSRRTALNADERSFTRNIPDPTTLLPKNSQTSVLLSVNHAATDKIDLFADVLFADGSNEYRHTVSTGSARQHQFSDLQRSSGSLGLRYDVFSDWQAELSGSYSRNRTDSNGTAVPAGSFGSIEIQNEFRLWNADLIANGSLFSIPGGRVRLAVGAAYRDEDFSSLLVDVNNNRVVQRHVSAGFAELHVPLVGADRAIPGARRLDLSLAARRDDYSDFGTTSNSKLGLVWTPLQGLDVRATVSTSFRAPYAFEAIGANVPTIATAVPFADPAGGAPVPVLLFVSGGEPLKPEESDNWAAGFSWRPQGAPGLNISFNYFDIEYTNRILRPPFNPNVLRELNVYGPLVRTFANDAEVQAVVDQVVAGGGAFFGSGVAGIRYSYSISQQNAALLEESGFDIGAEYGFTSGANAFTAGVSATIINEMLTSFGAGSDATDLVDTLSNPVGLRARANASWNRAGWTVASALNYTDDYIDPTAAVAAPVSSWTTFDMNVRRSWDGGSAQGLLAGASVGLSVINLFDEDPPAIVGSGLYPAGYDVGNATPQGRYISLDIVKQW